MSEQNSTDGATGANTNTNVNLLIGMVRELQSDASRQQDVVDRMYLWIRDLSRENSAIRNDIHALAESVSNKQKSHGD